MIPYKVIGKAQPGVRGGGEIRYCAVPVQRSILEPEDLEEYISSSSGISPADLAGVLKALQGAIVHNLKNGHAVRLRDIGIFSVSFGSELLEDKTKVTSKAIRNVRLNFLPDKKIKKELNRAQFKKHYSRKK